METKISMIVAVSKNGVIGKDGDIPWRLPNDMKYFKEKTMGHHVVMGRKTYESIPSKYRPLPGRTNIILSRDPEYKQEGCVVLKSVLEVLTHTLGEEETFIAGGSEIYNLFMEYCDRLYITIVDTVVSDGTAEFDMSAILDETVWNSKPVSRVEVKADDKNPYSHTFLVVEKL